MDKNIRDFLDRARSIRSKMQSDAVEDLKSLSRDYWDICSPEKEYLKSLQEFYHVGPKADYSGIEKGKVSLDTRIEELDFTINAINSIKKLNIKYLGQLVENPFVNIARLTKLNQSGLKNILDEVRKSGYSLGMKINYIPPEGRY